MKLPDIGVITLTADKHVKRASAYVARGYVNVRLHAMSKVLRTTVSRW